MTLKVLQSRAPVTRINRGYMQSESKDSKGEPVLLWATPEYNYDECSTSGQVKMNTCKALGSGRGVIIEMSD